MVDTPVITIIEQINRRVSERLVPAVLDRLACQHRKRAWRSCGCRFCSLKRKATAEIAYATPVYGLSRFVHDGSDGVIILDRRDEARSRYRRLLKEEFETW